MVTNGLLFRLQRRLLLVAAKPATLSDDLRPKFRVCDTMGLGLPYDEAHGGGEPSIGDSCCLIMRTGRA